MAVQVHAVVKTNDAGYPRLTRGEVVKTRWVRQVLSVVAWRGPEPHWDSGWSADTGVECRVFNGRTWSIVCPDGLRSDMIREFCYVCEEDASAATVLAAHKWQVWVDWFASLVATDRSNRKAREEHERISEGKRVLIVKGRKVPRGTYWYVDRAGNGTYGPYVHLSSEPRGMGDYQKFVSPENMTVAEPFAEPYTYLDSPAGKDDVILSLAHQWNALPRGVYGRWDDVANDESAILAVLADRLEEISSEEATVIRAAANAARPDECKYT